jgi:hypothetical protein
VEEALVKLDHRPRFRLVALLAAGLLAAAGGSSAQAQSQRHVHSPGGVSLDVSDPIVVASGVADSDPDVAFDATNATYLVVWRQREPGFGPGGVYGQRVLASGALSGDLLVIEGDPTVDASDPSVASVAASERFLVVWQEPTAAGSRIVGRTVGAATGELSATIEIASQGIECDVGGTSTLADAAAVVVWNDVPALALESARLEIPALGEPSVTKTATVHSGVPGLAEPEIAKSGGAAGRYLVLYENDHAFDSVYLDGVVIDGQLEFATTTAEHYRGGGFTGDFFRTSPVDGDGTSWTATWSYTANTELFALAYFFDGASGRLQNTNQSKIPSADGSNIAGAAVGSIGSSAFVATNDDGDARVELRDGITCSSCADSELLGSGVPGFDLMALCTEQSGDPAAGESALLVWESRGLADLSGDLLGYFLEARDGALRPLGGGCGPIVHRIGCATVGAAGFSSRLEGGVFGKLALLALSPSTAEFGCGACTIVPNLADPSLLFYLATVDRTGKARIALPIPDDTAFEGLTLVFQWAELADEPGCAAFGLDLTDAFEVTIER